VVETIYTPENYFARVLKVGRSSIRRSAGSGRA
jgi:hypothetical protein